MIIIVMLLSYLVGSIPTGYLLGKWMKGIDIREHGSGNVGATNVFRTVGKGWGILTFMRMGSGSVSSGQCYQRQLVVRGPWP